MRSPTSSVPLPAPEFSGSAVALALPENPAADVAVPVARNADDAPPSASPLDPRDPAARRLLADVQGGILSEHGRGDFGAIVLFAFRDPAAHAANSAAGRAAAARVTSALAQVDRAAAAPGSALRRGAFCSVAFTGAGLRACGLAPAGDGGAADDENFFPPDGLGHLDDGQFSEAVAVLHDPADAAGAPATWEAPYRGRIDGAWLLGHDSPEQLAAARTGLRDWLAAHDARVVAEELGHVRRDAAGTVREAFGFADGLAVPRLVASDPPRAAPSAEPWAEHLLRTGVHAGGTFLVLRKLEQHVRAFRAAHAPHEAAALVGRTADGVPLGVACGTAPGAPAGASRESEAPALKPPACFAPAAGPAAPGVAAGGEDFDFRGDPHGVGCPFHAHIRRANPRGVADFARGERRRLPLLRRGWVYGAPAALEDARGAEGGVGLLFLAYVRSLENFRTMQGDWLFRRGFPVAAAARRDELLFGEFTDDSGRRRRWVEPRGGAYFYVPSLTWLRTLRPATTPAGPAGFHSPASRP